MKESTRREEVSREDDETIQKRAKDGHHKDSANAGTGDSKGGPNNDRQVTERAGGGENQN